MCNIEDSKSPSERQRLIVQPGEDISRTSQRKQEKGEIREKRKEKEKKGKRKRKKSQRMLQA